MIDDPSIPLSSPYEDACADLAVDPSPRLTIGSDEQRRHLEAVRILCGIHRQFGGVHEEDVRLTAVACGMERDVWRLREMFGAGPRIGAGRWGE